MGIKNKNKKQKQMKVFAYLALICGVSAIKLSQKHSHLPTAKLIKVAHKIKGQSKAKTQGVNELEAWGAEQLADGGTITQAEAYDKMVELGVPESMMDELEAAFDAVDADGSGELDAAEVEAAMEHMGLDEDVDYPTEDEIIAAVEAELARDGGITKEEAAGAIAEWADSEGVTIPQEAWDVLEAGFDAVDADGDGELTAEEIGAAFPPPKKGKKGPKGGALLRLKSKLINKSKSKAKQGGLNEVEAFMAEQLADEGTITKEEAHAFAVEMGVPESMMDELEAGFDAVDANGDGELDAGEVEAAMEHMGIDEDVEWPTEDELVAAVEAELERDGGISKEEAAGAISAWADEQGVTIPQEAWDIMEAAFDEVDADGDGVLTGDELHAAFAEEEAAGPKGKKGGKKGKSLLKL